VRKTGGVASDGAGAAYARAFVQTRPGQRALVVLVCLILYGVTVLIGLSAPWQATPIVVAAVLVGVPLLIAIARDAMKLRMGADVLGLMAMVTGALMQEWLVVGIIALMVSGGEALESAASLRASQILAALADRSPTIAHLVASDGTLHDVPVDQVDVDDLVVVLPHEICPVDGVVVEGRGAMDESFLTGEPYVVPKAPGSSVMSGAINSTVPMRVRARTRAEDSRYAQIVGVLTQAERERPPIRRLADRLGAAYTLIAVAIAVLGWVISGDPQRFLAVLVIATPCPLLIGVPVAVIGAISLAARHGIIVKDPSMLERISTARTMIFDKTGTLTYGRPRLAEVFTAPGFDRAQVLAWVAAAEQFSRHPLASAVVEALETPLLAPDRVEEVPGKGLVARVAGHDIEVTGRAALVARSPESAALLPPEAAGLECVVLVDGVYAATLQFRDEPREGARSFIQHLPANHKVVRTILISGDRQSEVDYLAGHVGMDEAYASVAPEEKLRMVREETSRGPTVFLGDGINDAPAMTAATVGVAFGRNNDVTAEAADAVVLDSSLERLDELLHIGARMRRIALQTAIGGIALSVIGMGLAVVGLLPPVAGAIAQEVIDVLAILNATRVGLTRKPMADFRK
jgi:heavy metal translocating P-type ATPase